MHVLVGTGATVGVFPLLKINKENALQALIVQTISLNLPVEVEHQFGQYVHGLNVHIMGVPAIYIIGSAGYFFGGQIYQSQKTICYMKGGVNVGGIVAEGERCDCTYICKCMMVNPYIEFAWHSGMLVHALEIGCMFWLDSSLCFGQFMHARIFEEALEGKMPAGIPFNPSIKYKIMFKLG